MRTYQPRVLRKTVPAAGSGYLQHKRLAQLRVSNPWLEHQQRFGNRYVRRIAVSPGVVQRAVSLSDDDYTALAEQVHEAIAGLGTDERAIYASLQKLKKDASAIAKLKQVYKDKYKEDLVDAIRGDMSGEELRLALDLLGIQTEPKKGAMVGTVPSSPSEYKAAALKLYGAMKGLGTDEEAIYAVLIPFDRDATSLKTLKDTYQAELSGGLTGKGLEADLKDELSGDELAYALYLLNAPPPASPRATVTVTAPGTEAHAGKVPGGNVSVRTGAQFTAGATAYPEGFSIGYQGGLAADSRWLQFIWREIEVTHPAKGNYRVSGAVTTTGGTYNLTTDPGKPNYNTDSASASSPFYEAAFAANRTADATTMFDQPGSIQNRVNAEFAGGATKVTSRAHFNTFLIRDYKTIYHVYLEVEWAFTAPGATPRVQTVRSAGKADRLPADMKKRLVAQYPSFDYIL